MDPFAIGLQTLFATAAGQPAVFIRDGEEPKAIRIVHGRPDRLAGFGDGQTILGTNIFEIRRSDVAEPRKRDIVAIGATIVDGAIVGGDRFSLLGEAMIDVEGLTWTIGADPA